jgi:hypothetical protein
MIEAEIEALTDLIAKDAEIELLRKQIGEFQREVRLRADASQQLHLL